MAVWAQPSCRDWIVLLAAEVAGHLVVSDHTKMIMVRAQDSTAPSRCFVRTVLDLLLSMNGRSITPFEIFGGALKSTTRSS